MCKAGGDGVEQAASRKDGRIRDLTPEEGRELFDRAARYYLDMSGEEFIRKWDAGEFDDPDDRSKNPPEVMDVAMLLPFARD